MRNITHLVVHCTATPKNTTIASIPLHGRRISSPIIGEHGVLKAVSGYFTHRNLVIQWSTCICTGGSFTRSKIEGLEKAYGCAVVAASSNTGAIGFPVVVDSTLYVAVGFGVATDSFLFVIGPEGDLYPLIPVEMFDEFLRRPSDIPKVTAGAIRTPLEILYSNHKRSA